MKVLSEENSNNEYKLYDVPLKNPYETRPGEKPYKLELVWFNICAFIILHLAFFYTISLEFKSNYSIWFAFAYGIYGSLGITAGAHRLFCHRSYKANRPLTLFWLIAQTIAFQNSIIEWVRDHRVHHKYSDTNADPHNASRGFFFSHMGWLMCKKHPDVKRFGAKIDMSDLTSDWLIRFQHEYYLILMLFFAFILPTWLTCVIFGETAWVAFHQHVFKYVVSLHMTWLINSWAHKWGNKPYDRDILPTETCFVSTLALGEGWHNYHHVYPWDYKVAELPRYWCNMSLIFIDFFAWLGWATDLKTVSIDLIKKRVMRTGDGTHKIWSHQEIKKEEVIQKDENNNNNVDNNIKNKNDNVELLWGWGDSDMDDERMKITKILNKTEYTKKNGLNLIVKS